MNFKLEDNIKVYKEITNIYKDSVFDELEIKKDKLIEIFNNILKNNADSYELSTNSSINNIYYFTLKGRVKSDESFSEKLIRKDIGIELLNEFGDTKEKLVENKAILINRLKKLDDIIGIRVVTELREDTYRIYELIKDTVSDFNSEKINFHDLEHQPQIMKNGLKIFRIKGEYDDLISFELQIKSKIDEAWGEMDHTIFYKDHSSLPIRPTIQKTMNNVGVLLEKLETLLFGLRSSSQIFKANSKFIDFENQLFLNYGESIKQIFEFPISLGDISDIVFFLRNQLNIEIDINEPLNFDFLMFKVTKKLNVDIITYFHRSHKLILVEALFHCILKAKDKDLKVDEGSYEEIFENFTNFYFSYLNEKFFANSKDIDNNFYMDRYKGLMVFALGYIRNIDILLNYPKIKMSKEIEDFLKNSLDDLEDDKIKEIISNMFYISHFEGSTLEYYNSIKEDVDFDISGIIKNIETEIEHYDKNVFREKMQEIISLLKKIIS